MVGGSARKVQPTVRESSLVLWRPGLTAWITVWDNKHNESSELRKSELLQRRAPEAFAEKGATRDGVLFHMYRLAEPSGDKRVAALYGYAFGADGHVQMSLYFDEEKDAVVAESICLSVRNDLSATAAGGT